MIRRRPVGVLWIAGALTGALPAAVAAQDPIDQFADMDLTSAGSGIVLALYHEGQLDFLEAWGTVAEDSDEPLTTAHVFPFWEVTPALLAVTARSLARAGALDLDRPLGEYIPVITPSLAGATLEQLLTHRAGLDDARTTPGFFWEHILTDLSSGALLVPPGTAFSLSRYSYPAVAAVLRTVTGLGTAEMLEQAIFGPLGMTRTTYDPERARALGLPTGTIRDPATGEGVVVEVPAEAEGLPVLYTSAPDLIQFSAAWAAGALAGGDPLSAAGPLDPDESVFRDGVWIEDFRGVPHLVLDGEMPGFGAALRILPGSETVLLGWKNGSRVPHLSVGYVQGLVATALDLPEAEPVPEAQADAEPAPERPVPDAGEWAGIYGNGDVIVVLRAGPEGELVAFAGQDELPVRAVGTNAWGAFTPEGERTSLVFELDRLGETRVLRMANRIYLRMADEG